jgi:hypothetical protein
LRLYYFWFSVCALHDIEHAEGLQGVLAGST